MSDVCLDEFTDHGHCGVLTPSGVVDNDATVELSAQMAVLHAEVGIARPGGCVAVFHPVRGVLNRAGAGVDANEVLRADKLAEGRVKVRSPRVRLARRRGGLRGGDVARAMAEPAAGLQELAAQIATDPPSRRS
jgi:porphobilinogen synthase